MRRHLATVAAIVSGAASAGDENPITASTALAATEMPPPARADNPDVLPQTAKQRAAATTVMTT